MKIVMFLTLIALVCSVSYADGVGDHSCYKLEGTLIIDQQHYDLIGIDNSARTEVVTFQKLGELTNEVYSYEFMKGNTIVDINGEYIPTGIPGRDNGFFMYGDYNETLEFLIDIDLERLVVNGEVYQLQQIRTGLCHL